MEEKNLRPWEVPLSERPDWYQTEEGHWRHKSYGKKKRRPIGMSFIKIGRNQPCPCGSGIKYKKCCGG
jgi:SEC-C motif-containing protein